MKIKTFCECIDSDLDEKVNDYLVEISKRNFIYAIKFSTHFDYRFDRNVYCAMVITTEK